MRILYYGFGANNHSWGIVAQNFIRQFKKMGHEVDIFSTNGINHLPSDLSSNIIGHHPENIFTEISGKRPNEKYDMNFSFTMMRNFKKHLMFADQNRFGIWCYEWEKYFPPGLAKYEEFADLIFPCSEHAKKVFLDAKMSEKKLKIIPYGVDEDWYNFKDLHLKDDKTKYLTVMASTDGRKNIEGMFEAWCKAFNKDDSVIWIIKISKKNQKDLNPILNKYKSKYKNMAEIKVITDHIDYMQDLYYSCDIYYSLSRAESFLIPALEAVLSGKPVIASDHGGPLDFLNKNNSYLVSGSMTTPPINEIYYAAGINNLPEKTASNAKWFNPSIADAVVRLRESKRNHTDKKELIKQTHEEYKEKYSWKNLASEMIGYCK